MLTLVVDIGNTRIKTGIFGPTNVLEEQAVWPHDTLEDLSGYALQKGATHALLSTVAQPADKLMHLLSENLELVLELGADTPLPFQNKYSTPLTLGRDRLAAVAGAQWLFPNQNCLVMDCGTCIKYELLTSDGRYLGGNIAPGAGMRLHAMHVFTARLPEPDMQMPENNYGHSTVTALQNGALRGMLLEMTGFARLFQEQLSPLQPVLTGGDAAFFYPHFQSVLPETVFEPHLTLYGLNHILRHQLLPDRN